MQTKLACQSCGAKHEIDTSFARVVVCEYCGAVARLEGGTLTVVGSSAAISTGNPLFSLGDRGKLAGDEFRVLGRVRYHHTAGVWDEWQLSLDGRAVWVQHDEGEIVVFDEEHLITNYPPIGNVAVGTKVEVDGLRVFVSEIGEAVVAGMAGQIPRDTAIGQGFFYVDGIADGQAISLEYYFTEVWLSAGRALTRADLHIFQ